jgi:Flp pilus assembly protein TadG
MNIRRHPHAENFLRDTRGSVLPVFVFLIPVLLAVIGMAVDYSRASAANAKLQAALDATALAMSTKAPSLSASELSTQATAYFSALFTHTGVSD